MVKFKHIKQILFILLLLLSMGLHGQSHHAIRFHITNSTNEEAVSYASIIDRTHNIRYLSDELGNRELHLADSTLVKVSAIGFHDFYYLCANQTDTVFVKLLPKVYELKEYAVSPYPTIESFEKAFKNMELEEENVVAFNLLPIELMRPNKAIRTDYQTQELVSISFSSPISAFYDLYSKRAKSARKLKQLQIHDYQEKQYTKRYNKEIVRMLTGIQNEEKLEKMMDFCSPSKTFITHASDYEIAVFIIDCYEKFLISEI